MTDIKKHKHIVFGFEHYNPLGIVRSLGEKNIEPIGIIIKCDKPITSKSKYLKKVHFVSNIEEGYQVLLTVYGNENEKPFIYTSDDQITSFLDHKYDELIDKFYFFNAGKQGEINHYMDKYNICEMAKKHGIPVAKTWAVSRGEIPSDLIYPIITKAIVSTIDNWKQDSIICNNEAELKKAYETIASERVLLQQYIFKKNELCLDGFVSPHGKETVVTIASVYNYIIPDSYSHYMTIDNLKDDELYRKVSEMFREIGFTGIFSLELLIGPNDEYYFLEVNFRNSTWSYASTVVGMPLPELWAESVIKGSVDHSSLTRIDKPFTAMVEFDDFRARVKGKKIGLIQWLKDFKNCKVKFYYVKNDLKPICSVITAKFKRMTGRKK